MDGENAAHIARLAQIVDSLKANEALHAVHRAVFSADAVEIDDLFGVIDTRETSRTVLLTRQVVSLHGLSNYSTQPDLVFYQKHGSASNENIT